VEINAPYFVNVSLRTVQTQQFIYCSHSFVVANQTTLQTHHIRKFVLIFWWIFFVLRKAADLQ